ncbi:hypothetical protein AB1Y20_002450 [Prymnesium parvum]|uniref:La-related protein 7 n=1 Tax=Prymnesium parvum TaxID=97485 RepID=A0AB34J940_PRYPA
MDALVEQCAFYFSDANLRRDRFLRKHVGPQGIRPVPVSILATFNRVRTLTTDSDVLVEALRAVPGLHVSSDGASASRTRPLPEVDDSELRTVHVDRIPAASTIDSLHRLFAPCGAVAFVSLPRRPSREAAGFALVEFEHADAAVRAVAQLDGRVPEGAAEAVRCCHRRAWEEAKKARKKAKEAGEGEAEAEAAAARAAEAAARACAAEAAALAAAEAEEEERRTVVKVCGIPKGAPVKALRKEMREVFAAVAPVDYVDYGISNSGDTTLAFVRMKTAVGAAEARRVLMAQGQQLCGAPVFLELVKGKSLEAYLERIGKLRGETAASRRRKREQWWERKFGKKARKEGGAGEGAAGGGEGGSGDEGESEGASPTEACEADVGEKRRRVAEAEGELEAGMAPRKAAHV